MSQASPSRISSANTMLVKSNLKQLRLPTMHAEFEKLAREAASGQRELRTVPAASDRAGGGGPLGQCAGDTHQEADFPVHKEFDTLRFLRHAELEQAEDPGVGPRRMARPACNCCFVGNAGTGKTHLAISLGLAACRHGCACVSSRRPALVNRLEEAQKQYQLDRFLGQLDRADLLICDELGYLSFSRAGAELLFQVFADRYERKSLLLTSNLAFSEWGQIFQGERMTAALAGPTDAPLPHFRDEWRKLPLPRVDESEEEQGSQGQGRRQGDGQERKRIEVL